MAVLAAALLVISGVARAQPADSDSDEAGLAMQMTTAENNIKTSSALIRDAAINTYLRGVVCTVAARSCAALRVYLVEMPGENVIALPNGALVIWSGTLIRLENEAQLAHLLAHEIAHYLHKDPISQYQRRLDTSGLVALLGVAASGVGMGFMGTPASMAALDARYAHSASEEDAADRTGMQLASAAGYDPQAVQAVWRNADPDFLRLHPGHDAGLVLSQDVAGSWKTGTESYHAAVAPFLSRWVDDELRNNADGVTLFARLAGSGRGLFHYGLGEAYRKRGQPGDAALAKQAFRAALAAPASEPQAWRGLGLLAMQQGDKAAARIAFAQYRSALPFADDRAMIDYYLAQP
jgi:beta-barrel assembly-enhancing protease